MSQEMYRINLPIINDKTLFKISDCQIGSGFYLIKCGHPSLVRNAVYKLATYFRREFSYDFVQYSTGNDEDDDKCHAYIWTIYDYKGEIVIGSCCFRYRKYKDYQSGWALQWIWFHPFERNKGLLSQRWDYFEKEYGFDFYVEPPISPAMKGFLKERNFELHTKGYTKE